MRLATPRSRKYGAWHVSLTVHARFLPRVFILFGCWLLLGGCLPDDEIPFVAKPSIPRHCKFTPAPVSQNLGSHEFSRIATRDQIPGLATQDSERSHIIGVLHAFDGAVYLGYGDTKNNTGPIMMAAWRPELGAFINTSTIQTEDVRRFLEHEGHLFTTNIDPKGHAVEGGLFRMGCDNQLEKPIDNAWFPTTPIAGAVHVYDLVVHEGRLYASTGSVPGEPARIMWTTDGGATWQQEFTLPSGKNEFARLYHLGVTSKRLFASGWIYGDSKVQRAFVREFGEWHEVTGLQGADSLIPITLDDQMMIVGFEDDFGKTTSFLGTYSLEGHRLTSSEVMPAGHSLVNWNLSLSTVSGIFSDTLWVLTRDASGFHVFRTSDFSAWEIVSSLPALDEDEFTSIAYLNNAIYLGTAFGSFYELSPIFTPIKDTSTIKK